MARALRHAGASRRAMAETCGHRPRFRCTLPLHPARTKSTGRIEFGIGRRVVSQLLAGPRSGPGGSPTPPRVLHSRRVKPAGTPHLVRTSRRLMMRPLRGRGEPSVSEVWKAGIGWGYNSANVSSLPLWRGLSAAVLWRSLQAPKGARALPQRESGGVPTGFSAGFSTIRHVLLDRF